MSLHLASISKEFLGSRMHSCTGAKKAGGFGPHVPLRFTNLGSTTFISRLLVARFGLGAKAEITKGWHFVVLAAAMEWFNDGAEGIEAYELILDTQRLGRVRG